MSDDEKVEKVVEKTKEIVARRPQISYPKAGWLAIGHIPAIKQHEATRIHSAAMRKFNQHADVARSTPA